MSGEEALWEALDDGDGERARFACAMLLKLRGHVRLPAQLLRTVAEDDDRVWVQGLRALRDRRCARHLTAAATESTDVCVVRVAMRGLFELGARHEVAVPADLMCNHDPEVRHLARALEVMEEA